MMMNKKAKEIGAKNTNFVTLEQQTFLVHSYIWTRRFMFQH